MEIQEDVSSVFHGRDIFAPIAAKISRNKGVEELGEEIHEYVDLNFGGSITKEGFIKGKILFIDRFGNIVTNIRKEHLKAEQFHIKIGIIEKTIKTYPSYGFAEKGEIISVMGSSGFLEIAMREGSAAKYFGAHEKRTIEIFF